MEKQEQNKNLRQERDGFTLIELMVVIAIIAILATLVLPGLMSGKKKAIMLQCLNNLRALRQGIEMYSMDYGYPPEPGKRFWEALREYPSREASEFGDKNHGVYLCPVMLGGGGTGGDFGRSDYLGPNYKITGATPDTMPMGSDHPDNHMEGTRQGTINVVLFGTKVIRVAPDTPVWKECFEGVGEDPPAILVEKD